MTVNPHRRISSQYSRSHGVFAAPNFPPYQRMTDHDRTFPGEPVSSSRHDIRAGRRARTSPTKRGNEDYHRYRACKGRNVATVASLGHSTCRACDAEASRDTDDRWGLDAQRRGYRPRQGPAATATFSGARFLHTEMFVFRSRTAGTLELPAVRMDNGWQAVDSTAAVADTAPRETRSAAD